MNETDGELLAAYARRNDQEAFREIVSRHAQMVYSAAVRQMGSGGGGAEDVTQAVFIVLARKARQVNGNTLAGWLINATRLISRDAQRREMRHRNREKKAAAMKKQVEENHPNGRGGEGWGDGEMRRWGEVLPLLDKALGRLREKDRCAVTLRYLEGKEIEEVARLMGISRDAAAKRLSRAVGKLREDCAERGVAMPVGGFDVLGGMLLAHGRVSMPDGLASKAAAAGAAAISGDPGVTSSAGLLAKGAIAAGTRKVFWRSAAAALIVLIGFAASYPVWRGQSPSSAAAPKAQAAAKIKVGVLVSELTATGYTREHYDISHQSIIRYLNSPELEIFVIVEPGPQTVFANVIRKYAAPDHLIVGTDVEKLKQLDVIVAGHTWLVPPAVIDAIGSAVGSGVGMLQQAGFAVLAPSFTPQVCQLLQMDDGGFFVYQGAVACRVAREHPLLKGLKTGDTLHAAALYGVIGTFHGTPLIEAPGLANTGFTEDWRAFMSRALDRPIEVRSSAESADSGVMFYPLYVGQYGRGRLVGCQWHNFAPRELDPSGDGSFYLRCIKWLAGRPLQ